MDDSNSFSDRLTNKPDKDKGIEKYFHYWTDLSVDIVTGLDPYGIITISKLELVKLGYSDKQSIEEQLLKIYEKVEKLTGIDIYEIKMKMKDRVNYI
jgi:hypothetical protein